MNTLIGRAKKFHKVREREKERKRIASYRKGKPGERERERKRRKELVLFLLFLLVFGFAVDAFVHFGAAIMRCASRLLLVRARARLARADSSLPSKVKRNNWTGKERTRWKPREERREKKKEKEQKRSMKGVENNRVEKKRTLREVSFVSCSFPDDRFGSSFPSTLSLRLSVHPNPIRVCCAFSFYTLREF